MESTIIRQAPGPRMHRPTCRVVQLLGGDRTSCFLFVTVEDWLWKDAIVAQGPGCSIGEIMYRINSDQRWVMPIECETRASVGHTPHTRPSTFARQTSAHATAVSKMSFVARHVTRSSLSLGTAGRRPGALGVRLTGMGLNKLALRTLISKSMLP